jgi:hypothetical protein
MIPVITEFYQRMFAFSAILLPLNKCSMWNSTAFVVSVTVRNSDKFLLGQASEIHDRATWPLPTQTLSIQA